MNPTTAETPPLRDPWDLQPGDAIDVWVVEGSLGAGGMASVYRCRNRDAGRIQAAIKVLGDHLSARSDARARFVREAELLFSLRHPHIVEVRNVRLDASPPYIEMALVEGESLAHRLRRGPVSTDLALRYVRQLVDAVGYLHAAGVCHRDIKPANLLVRDGTDVVLVDFGLATEPSSGEQLTRAGQLLGTIAYTPPEWVRPNLLEPERWDFYAIGVVLHEMLTGEQAYPEPPGANPRQTALRIMADKQGVPFLDPGEGVPDGLRALVRDLTASDPADRLCDASDALARIDAVVSTVGAAPDVAPDPAASQEATLAMPRRAGIAAPLAAAAIGGIGLASFAAATGVLGLALAVGIALRPTPADTELESPAPEPIAARVEEPTPEPEPVAPPVEPDPVAPAVEPAPKVEKPTATPSPAPAVPRRSQPVTAPAPERPTPAPAVVDGAAATAVSAADFGAWVSRHPEWSRDAAIGAGKADGNYLLDFDAGSGGPATEVSWYAARAYCAGHRGLAPVGATPRSWTESSTAPFQEWRVGDDGRAAWRRFDGAASDALVRTASNAFTGFRCAQ